MVGYFEGIDSERGIEWRCSDSLSLRAFLRLETSERVPDHSWLSRTRGRLPHEVHDRVFGWVLSLLAEHGLVRGARIGVDASTMEANAALRQIVRRDTGEDYRAMLTRMARESGIETPSAEDLVRLDRKRKGRKLSNQAWVSETDPQARVAKMKNGTTHLAYKPEHAVDLDTGAVAGGRTASRRQGRHQDDRGHAGECQKPSVGCRRPTFVGRAGGVCGRQRLPFARRSERPGRWPLDVPDRRAAARGIFPLARGRRGAQGGLQQSRPSAIGHRQRGHAQAGRDRRAVLRPHPGSGRHAANLAARS